MGDKVKKGVLIAGLFNKPGAPVTQAAVLFDVLRYNGYKVTGVSSVKNRLLRLFDIVFSMLFVRGAYDVIIVQFYSGQSLVWQHIAVSLAKLLRKKIVITVHGGNVPERMKVHPRRYLRVLKKADAITCPSDFIINALKPYGITATKVLNAVILETYFTREKEAIRPSLLWMRAFSSIYNPEMAVKVLQALKPKYPEIKLFMGGYDLGGQKDIEAMIVASGLQDNIELIGFMDHDAKIAYAHEADIFISTNRIDNAPVSVVEMWALGLPVVSTDVGGMRYMIDDGETGLLAKDDDADDMAKRIDLLLSQPELAARIVRNGKEQAKRYDAQYVFKDWDALLSAL